MPDTYIPDTKRPLYRMCYLCKVIEGPKQPLEPLPGNEDLLACPCCTEINCHYFHQEGTE